MRNRTETLNISYQKAEAVLKQIEPTYLRRSLLSIFEIMDGEEWDADTAGRIAQEFERQFGITFLGPDEIEED